VQKEAAMTIPTSDRPQDLPGLRRIVAPNPSPLTGDGTNTWLLGTKDVAVIDPGPMLPAHLDAILGALGPHERISHILVTHAHRDHSPLARALAQATGAPVLAFGDAQAGRNPDFDRLSGLGASEGVDHDFAPDICLPDGAVVSAADWSLDVIHTPGHLGNHICLRMGDTVFSGDHVMGWATSIVSPPDGDMGAYMASLHRLAAIGARRMLPGHGAPIENAPARVAELIAHRQGREAAILAQLATGAALPTEITARVYAGLPPHLLPAAERNVLAHLLDLHARSRVITDAVPTPTSRFALA
jgi:hydroxyacylglutathione hydrolase